jgi:Uma2 family endonuclease
VWIMQVKEQHLTADDLLALSHEGQRWELVRGALVETAPTGDVHGVVTMWLGHLLLAYVDEHDLGEVTAAETGFRLTTDPDTVRAPDVGLILKEHLVPLTGGYYPLAPDLAVEVVSPGDSASLIHDKVRDYLQAGTRLVWVVYPSSHTVAVHTAQGAETFSGDETLTGKPVLPGFSLAASEVFKKLRS